MAGDNKSVKLKIDNVYKEYDTSKGKMIALNGVNLDIAENEFICVVGPSGCGKSTMLNIIAGLLEPTSGNVYLDGKPIEGTGVERGVVFQQYALFPWRTVIKNVMFGLEMKKVPKDQEGNNRVCILFMGDHCRGFSQETYEICEEIQNKVKEVIGIEVSAGIGGWVKNPEELIHSHEQAENAIGLRYLLGGNLLIDTEEQKEERSLSLQQSLNEMTNGIRNGNLQAVNHALSDMKEKIKNARADKSQACVCLQMILRHAGSCWESVTSGGEDLFHKRELLMGKVTEQKTFDEAFLLAENYVHEVFERCSSMNSSSGQKQAVLAMEYIRAHYMEQELSLNDICSYLNISTSYFSTIFKEATGGTFLEFLSRIRMEKTKELLEQTTLKNYEIAEMVGFSDPHYFSISFKKMTGKTPTEYAREKRSV